MDTETLYNMVKASAQSAEQLLLRQKSTDDRSNLGVSYALEYNRFAELAREQFGDEAARLFTHVGTRDRHMMIGAASILEDASVHLTSLAAYLQSKLRTPDRQVAAIIDLIDLNLRPSIFDDPDSEKEVQNQLETIFRARGLDFRREKNNIPYSSKAYVPDFTLESLDLAVEVKLVKSKDKEKPLIDEINADIPAYQRKYRHILFVVYDLGCIRDVALFKTGIEGNPDVHVLVIKK